MLYCIKVYSYIVLVIFAQKKSMLTQNKIKLIRSLDKKKYRQKHRCFVIEGEKMVNDALKSGKFNLIETFTTNENLVHQFIDKPITLISEKELQKVSFLTTPNQSLALFELPETKNLPMVDDLVLALDHIQDPGNLGTIIRTASWFGIKNIVCSINSVDIYGPKVVQATMSGILNIQVFYTDLYHFLKETKQQQILIYGTHLQGENLYKTKLKKPAVIVMGNESKGISDEIASLLTHKIFIPNYPENNQQTESLNVGIACAITLAEFRRG